MYFVTEGIKHEPFFPPHSFKKEQKAVKAHAHHIL